MIKGTTVDHTRRLRQTALLAAAVLTLDMLLANGIGTAAATPHLSPSTARTDAPSGDAAPAMSEVADADEQVHGTGEPRPQHTGDAPRGHLGPDGHHGQPRPHHRASASASASR
ncbi:hypothetical protein [Streptomyces aureus]|uniref:hypothetical protein n=1 Tax=Streptomyces aureus TaxID=193461 RepID=UPI00056A8B6B|nr:hypothetical protein [Streptomyces aureus]